jgi:hypothetical protein
MRPVLIVLAGLLMASTARAGRRFEYTQEARQTEAPATREPGLTMLRNGMEKSAGDRVATLVISGGCGSLGVGIAFDGENLWLSCAGSTPDLLRANPLTGVVDASYDIAGGLGAIAYDCTDNSILAGWVNSDGIVHRIVLDDNQQVISSGVLFDAGRHPMVGGLCDGIAVDVTTVPRTVYLSDDGSVTVHRYLYDGTHVPRVDDSPWTGTGPDCYSSGLALGGGDLYQGGDGCGHVWVHSKTPWPMVGPNSFDFVTGGRDEGLACDDSTFPVDVMWTVDANLYDVAYAFEIPDGSCQTCAAGPPPPDPCDLSQIEAKLDVLEPKADDIKAEITDIKAEVIDLKAETRDIKAEITDMKAEVRDIKAELVNLADDFAAKFCVIIRLLNTPEGQRAACEPAVVDNCGTTYSWNSQSTGGPKPDPAPCARLSTHKHPRR